MNSTKNIQWISFSCLKAAEGGMSKDYALQMLRENGVNCKNDSAGSPYVGHYAILVDKRHERKAQRLLWG